MTDYEKLLVIIHNDPLAISDAIILLEGDGFNRLEHAVDLYKKGYAPKIVFSGGIVDYAYGSYPYQECLPKLLDMGIPMDDIIYESTSLHTKQQAQNVAGIIRDNDWKRVILVATPQHQCRAYLTFLKYLPDSVILINSTAPILNWYRDEGWGSHFDLLEQEENRIHVYMEKKDLSTIEFALDYQKWKEKQLLK